MTKIQRLTKRTNRLWAPPPRLKLSEWADDHFKLSAQSSAKAGQWRTLGYQREIMDAISDRRVERVSVIKSARVGWTKIINATVGFYMHHDPCPIMVVQPTIGDAEDYSKEEIEPMIEDMKILKRLVAKPKSRSSGNTILHKRFIGGSVSMVGADSGRGFRRVSRKVVAFDEVDGYAAMAGAGARAEGDQIKLGMKRTEHYWDRKIIMGSTPLIEGSSRIAVAFAEGDRRRYHVPCPVCGHMQVLRFPNLKWEGEPPRAAWFECESERKCRIEERHKRTMVERGQWVAEAPFEGHASFHIWAAYSMAANATWRHIAREFVTANREGANSLQTFVNTTLGEAWQDRGEAPDWKRLFDRAEMYKADCLPAGVVFITVGVDVQGNRVVWEVVGWGRGKESWSLDAGDMPGDTGNEASEAYAALDAILDRDYQTEDGRHLRVAMLAIDSGHQANTVYNWTRRHSKARVIAIKGRGSLQSIVGAPIKVDVTVRGKKLAGGQQYYPVGINIIKSELYGWLKRDKPDNDEEILPGYCHFPEYGQDFFKQLTAEHLVTRRNKKGYVVTEWEQIPGRENHYLDCRVYARAAAYLYGLDRARESDWVRMGAVAVKRAAPPQAQHAPPEMQAPAASVARKSPESSNWLSTSRPVSSRRGGWFSRR